MAPAGAPASPHHWFTCVCIVHIDIHIPANSIISSRQSDDDTRSLLPARLAVGRAAVVIPTGGRIATGRAEPRSGEGGGAKAEAGNMEGDGGRKRAVKTHEH